MDMFLAVAVPLLVQGLAGEISRIKSQLGGFMARLTRWRKKNVFIRKIAYDKVKGRDVASSRFASPENHFLFQDCLAVCLACVE